MAGAAVIIGASGGIGGALADAIADEGAFDVVHRFGRSLKGDAHCDVTDESSIAAAAARVAKGPAPTLVIVASGLLHEGDSGPEKALGQIDGEWMLRNFAVNSVGPMLVAKHFVPLLPRTGTPVFAALSARVGSITDNRLGGWYSYRASKTALNMLIRTVAIEAKRMSDRSIVVALHPGTVDTALSKPFQGNVAPGQLFDAGRAAVQLLDVIDGLGPKDSGRIFAWDGAEIVP
ncbi:SDR family NAD(P)-dependent oxidoreductase [Stakelama tenebrarum]|uniref:SDR family NAD(P)-dependent oxidoreductase n=1 Tax=Stakelama tenebrarum TaxID=2711215 RepID=A0A6G6Y4U0_9SPHN|nr:SDR family NAD(P)-dependent oxidoreductase [Sphingosinithalassobacter tenebrarum]QIG79920.1 SDR family NAD(P)-dependent oxidoreductase [Sphingosinithalassobacter tenebrarum]